VPARLADRMPSPLRPLLALAAFPAGWAVREQGSAGVGGIVVLVLIAAAAAGLPRGAAARVVLLGIACFVAVHLIAAVTATYVGIALGALAFAAIVSAAWRTSPST
jgi:hypothetical protein